MNKNITLESQKSFEENIHNNNNIYKKFQFIKNKNKFSFNKFNEKLLINNLKKFNKFKSKNSGIFFSLLPQLKK